MASSHEQNAVMNLVRVAVKLDAELISSVVA
jgi:hypothetical protein